MLKFKKMCLWCDCVGIVWENEVDDPDNDIDAVWEQFGASIGGHVPLLRGHESHDA